MILKPKNWTKFQHYKDRCPPWIKLHRDLLNDRNFIRLPLASKAIAPLLWLLASESQTGEFDATEDEICFRLRITSKEYRDGIKPLIDNGFFEVASGVLADCQQVAIPETERETETEKNISASVDASFSESFLTWWSAYPRKDNKQAAWKSWQKQKLDAIAEDVQAKTDSVVRKNNWHKDSTYCPHGSTFLNGKRWQEAEEVKAKPALPATKRVRVNSDRNNPIYEEWPMEKWLAFEAEQRARVVHPSMQGVDL